MATYPDMVPPRLNMEKGCASSDVLDGDRMRHTNTSVCACHCVFLDIGLNDGDSLLKWPHDRLLQRQAAASQMVRECLDPLHAATTCFVGIEPNPTFTDRLRMLERRARARGVRVQVLTQTALALTDGHATLFVDEKDGGVGSTLEASKKQVNLVPGVGIRRYNHSVATVYPRESVRTLSAAPFLRSLLAASRFVGVKLDIEGYEYALLRSLLVTHPEVVCGLGILAAEWHEHMMTDNAVPAGVSVALQWLLEGPGCGVPLVRWKR